MDNKPEKKMTTATAIAVILQDIGYIKTNITEIKTLVLNNYVTKEEFDPVKKLAYGLISVVLIGVLGAILTLIINNVGYEIVP